MTYINNAIMLIEEEIAGNMSNKHDSNKVQDKNIWKSLRTHILSRREKNKQAEVDAEVLRKKKCVEYQKMQENKLSLAQINGRLSQLQNKRDELEEEKRALLSQSQATDDSMATALVVPKTESNCEPINNKAVVANNINNAAVTNHRTTPLLQQQQQQHIFRQQTTTVNAQSGAGSPAAGSGLSPLAQQSLMMHNSSTSNTGGSNQTLLVCSPATINAANNQNNNVTRSTMSLAASLTSTMTFTKFPTLYSSSTTTHLLAPNVGTSNKMGRTPSPQPQTIQQQNYQQPQIVVPFPPYKPMNSGGSTTNNLNSTAPAPVVNTINQSLAPGTNSNYPIENSNRRGNREDTTQSFNRNVWINNNSNKNLQPNVSSYGSFYQPNSTSAVNYCVNNGLLSSAPSLSSVNTVYSYSGPPPPPPPPPPRTETSTSGNLIVSTAGDHGAQQIPKPLSSHQHHQPHHHAHSHPPMYMSPGIRNQTSNHTYHPKPPHSVYPDDKLAPPPPSNFYQQQGNRNINLSNTTTVSSQPYGHQMNQKPHNIGYPMRHPTAASSASQLSPAIIQSSQQQHASYTVPTSSVTGYSNKPPATVVSTADIPRYQQPPPQTPMSRHE